MTDDTNVNGHDSADDSQTQATGGEHIMAKHKIKNCPLSQQPQGLLAFQVGGYNPVFNAKPSEKGSR